MSEDRAEYRVDGRVVNLQPHGDGRDWARRLLVQFSDGVKRPPTVYRMAHEALGLPVPQGLRA